MWLGLTIILVMFKCYKNTCKRKSSMKICVMLFKQRKLLFKEHNQTCPKSATSQNHRA